MKIKVQQISEGDLALRARWLNDHRVNAFQFLTEPVTPETTSGWFSRIRNNPTRSDLVFRDEPGRCLAMAGLTAISATAANAEYYVFINPELQGMGIGRVVTGWMLYYAFEVRNLLRLYLYVDPRNVRAVKLYEKLHFSREGILRKHRSKGSDFFDMHVYGMLREEWLAQQRAVLTVVQECP